jgi:hypothetical protein
MYVLIPPLLWPFTIAVVLMDIFMGNWKRLGFPKTFRDYFCHGLRAFRFLNPVFPVVLSLLPKTQSKLSIHF